MKTTYKFIIFTALTIFLISSVSIEAKRARKLPAKSYITTAKIEIIGGQKDPSRYKTAIAMLDSLFMHYGPHAEGLFWMTQIYVDYANQEADLKKKKDNISIFAAYRDSLNAACDNKEIKKKYLKKCKSSAEKADSISVKFWREFYNAGVVQILELDTIINYINTEEDSVLKVKYEEELVAKADSAKDNMFLAMELDPSDFQLYVGLATVSKKMKQLDEAIEWLKQALDRGGNRNEVLTELAYTHIEKNDYCGATPYFQEYVDLVTADTEMMANEDNLKAIISTMNNLTISYNNCKKYDSAYFILHRILKYEPNNAEVLAGCSRYFRQLSVITGDSVKKYLETDEVKHKEFSEIRTDQFDSARVYSKRYFDSDIESLEAAESYGLVSSVLEKHDEAKIAFERATQLAPEVVENWISLGDSNLRLNDFQASADAYEKAVELDPTNKDIWESLEALYLELGNKKRSAEIKKKISLM